MNKEFCKDINDLLALFENSLSPAEILSAKLMGQISSSITKERLKLHMNQHSFANHIGVTQSQVSRWEQGDYNFTIKKIAEVATALNLDVNITMMDIESSKLIHKEPLIAFQTKTIQYSVKDACSSSTKKYIKESYSSQKNNSKEEMSYATIC